MPITSDGVRYVQSLGGYLAFGLRMLLPNMAAGKNDSEQDGGEA
jgi:hypothetical protein